MRAGASPALPWGDPAGAERGQRLEQHRRARVVTLCGQPRLAVQKKIVACRFGGRGRRENGLGDVENPLALRQPAGGEGRVDRVPVRLTGEPGVERLQSPGRFEQQRQAGAGAVGRGHDPSAQQNRPCGSEVVEGTQLGRPRQFPRGVESAGLVLGLCRRQRPGSTTRGVGRQLGGPVEEGRRRGHSATRLRPGRRPLQLGGHRLVGSRRRTRQMPRPTVRILLGVGHVRQGSVHLAQVDRPAAR